tara:strand:- start:51 stop:533 length:483 start_codon:yes stop_codon:yes gene_type:complete
MDFYGQEIMWVKKQKKIENKLFHELVTNATKQYGTWEYKLNYVENLLKYNHINEWEYTEKLNALKSQFDYFNTDDSSDDDDDEIEVEQIDETDTHLLVRENGPVSYGFLSNGQPSNRYYVCTIGEHGGGDTIFHIINDAQAIQWFRRGVFVLPLITCPDC